MVKKQEKREFVAPKLGLQEMQGEQILVGSGSETSGENKTQSIADGGTIPGFSKMQPGVSLEF